MRQRAGDIAWFLAGGLLWAGVDLLQVTLAIGGQSLGRLTPVVVVFYVFAAVLLWLATRGLRTLFGDSEQAVSLATAIVVPGAALAIAYLNFVHLPDFTSPLSLAANGLLFAVAALAWRVAAKADLSRRAECSRLAPLAIGAIGIALTALTARGWARTEQPVTVASADDRPSIFVVAIDSLRADRLRLDDGPTLTPSLRELARRGTAFSRAYAHASWTKPSVASLLSSLYPSTHRANLRRDRLSSEAVTLAEVFAQVGYRTAVFSANPWISPAFGFERGVAHFVEAEHETFGRLVLLWRVLRAVDRPTGSRPLSRAIAAAERAAGLSTPRRTNCERDRVLLEAVDQWLSAPASGPVFAYVHLMSPHIPYEPPTGTSGFDDAAQVDLLMRTEPLAEQRQEHLLRLYDETVAHSDGVLAALLAVLERNGLGERTIVVVTADHGEEFFEHGRFGHGKSLYDEVVRVPLVFAGPRVPESRGPRTSVASHVDVAPTLAALAGIAPSPMWSGRDLFATAGAAPLAYAELIREGGLETYMITDGRRKLVETIERIGADARVETYDLASDPGEREPRAPRGDEPLAAQLRLYRERARSSALAAQDTAIDRDAEERLRALGYIN